MIALWKGWLPSVIGVIPYVGLNFAVYETLKDSVLKFYGAPSLSLMLCSSAQGVPCLSPVQCTPIENKLHFEQHPDLSQSIVILRLAVMKKLCIHDMIMLQSRASCKQIMGMILVSSVADLNDERELSTLTRLACGGIAGTTGQTVAYPLDVVRRRMQVSPHWI